MATSTIHCTPARLAEWVAALAAPRHGEVVLDPSCGTGALLLAAAKWAGGIRALGQDIEVDRAIVTRRALTEAGVSRHEVAVGDTLRSPFHDQGRTGGYSDVVLANPPFSDTSWPRQQWSADPRSWAGVRAGSRADGAWLQHCIHALKPSGRAVVVMPHGFAYRQGADLDLRRELVARGHLHAVIQLPELSFGTASVGVILLVLTKSSTADTQPVLLDGTAAWLGGADIVQHVRVGRPGLEPECSMPWTHLPEGATSWLPRHHLPALNSSPANELPSPRPPEAPVRSIPPPRIAPRPGPLRVCPHRVELGQMAAPIRGARRYRAGASGDIPVLGPSGPLATTRDPTFTGEVVILTQQGAALTDPTKAAAYRWSGPACASSHVLVLRSDPAQVDAGYLAHMLNGAIPLGASESGNLSWASVRSIRLPLPPLLEQQQIREVLDTAQDETKTLVRATALAQQRLRDAVLARSLPCAEDPRVGDVSTSLDAARRHLSRVQREQRRGSIPFVGATGPIDLVDEAIFDEPLVCVTETGRRLLAGAELPLSFTSKGPAWIGIHAHALRPTDCSLDSLQLALQHVDVSRVLRTGTIPRLPLGDLMRLRVRLPDQPEEDALVRLRDDWRSLEKQSRQAQAQAVTAPRHLLSDLVAGVDWRLTAMRILRS